MQIQYCDGCNTRTDEEEAVIIGDKLYCPNCAKTKAPARSTPPRGMARQTPGGSKGRSTPSSTGGMRSQPRASARSTERESADSPEAAHGGRNAMAFWALVAAGILFAGAGIGLMLNARSMDSAYNEKAEAEKAKKEEEKKAAEKEKKPPVPASGNKPVIESSPSTVKPEKAEKPATKPAPPDPPREDSSKLGLLAPEDEGPRDRAATRLYTQITDYEKSDRRNAYELRKKYEQFMLSYASTKHGKEIGEKLNALPPVPRRPADNPANTVPGLAVTSYEKNGEVSATSLNTKNLKFLATSVVEKLELNGRGEIGRAFGREDNVVADINGFIDIPADGVYKFILRSDDGSALFIGESLVVENDRYGGMEPPKDGSIDLAKGKHAIRVTYYQGNGDAGLKAAWAGPGVTEQIIPASAFSHAVK